MLASLELGQQLLDGLLDFREFRNERLSVQYREITRYTAPTQRRPFDCKKIGSPPFRVDPHTLRTGCLQVVSRLTLLSRAQIENRVMPNFK